MRLLQSAPLCVFAVASVCVVPGCATSLSGFRPAHVPEKGGVHVAAGMDISAPTGTIGDVVDVGKTAARAAQARELTEAERDQIFDAGLVLATNPPSILQHLMLAYAPLERTEVSLRYTGGAWRFGGRYQIWEQGQGHDWDLTAGLGVARQSVSVPVGNVLDVLRVNDYVRWGFDLPVTIGRRGQWYRLWGGPRLMYTRGDAGFRLNLPAVGGSPARTETASAETHGFYWGGQGGFALGYERVFLGFELNLVQFSGQATVTVGDRTRSVDVSTFIVYPGLALMAEF